jgi:hypothetical protein
MLSDGSDGKRLRTSVQFLAGHEGQYRLGSVAFSADTADKDSNSSPLPKDEHPPAEQPADTGIAMHVLLSAVVYQRNLQEGRLASVVLSLPGCPAQMYGWRWMLSLHQPAGSPFWRQR